jgi:hypothetical protein
MQSVSEMRDRKANGERGKGDAILCAANGWRRPVVFND